MKIFCLLFIAKRRQFWEHTTHLITSYVYTSNGSQLTTNLQSFCHLDKKHNGMWNTLLFLYSRLAISSTWVANRTNTLISSTLTLCPLMVRAWAAISLARLQLTKVVFSGADNNISLDLAPMSMLADIWVEVRNGLYLISDDNTTKVQFACSNICTTYTHVCCEQISRRHIRSKKGTVLTRQTPATIFINRMRALSSTYNTQ